MQLPVPEVLSEFLFIQITADQNPVFLCRYMLYPTPARQNVRFYLVIHPKGILKLEIQIIFLMNF